MSSALTIFTQIIKMFVMVAVGYTLVKKGIVNEDTTARLSNILLMVATPCTLLTSFNQTYSQEKMLGLAVAFGLSFLVYFFNIGIVQLLYKKEQRIEKFSVAFSNAGFLGIPLVTGLLGSAAVFYLSPFIAGFYIFAWTYGVYLMSGKKESVTIKKILTNPCILAVVGGIVLFISPIKPFAPIMEAISTLGSMNTPLAMLILGAYMARSSLLAIFTNKKAYLVSIYRMLLLPVLLVGLFSFVPERFHEIRLIILISASAPVAALVPVFAQMFDRDTVHGAQIVCLSTLLSLGCMPFILLLAEWVW